MRYSTASPTNNTPASLDLMRTPNPLLPDMGSMLNSGPAADATLMGAQLGRVEASSTGRLVPRGVAQGGTAANSWAALGALDTTGGTGITGLNMSGTV